MIRLQHAAAARPCGVLIALDRQERATEGDQDVEYSGAIRHAHLHLKVVSIATLHDLLQYLSSASDPALSVFAEPVRGIAIDTEF